MQRRSTQVGVLFVAMLALLLAGLVSAPAQAGPKRNFPTKYNPPAGVKINNPLGTFLERRVIIRHIIQSISATPRGAKIRIATWNLRSDDIIDELIQAHKRGVSVRLIIDAGNANELNPNEGFDRLQLELDLRNEGRLLSQTSWAKRCKGSCRGASGIAHTKMFLFSKVGKRARWVSIFGSANATDLAAGYQWNDVYTLKNRPALWERFHAIFNEMALDAPAPEPYESFGPSNRKAEVYPYLGTGAVETDPMLTELGRVRCDGSTHGAARNAKTIVRIAMTAMSDERGIALAERLRQMWERGCSMRIVYAVMGKQVLDIMRRDTGRGPVPIKQIAQDWNLDGLYDRYLHMKTITVAGVYDGKTNANVTWNGSANWTSMALKSDEVGMRIFLPQVRQKYAKWFDYLYENPPPRPELLRDPEVTTTEARGISGLAALVNGDLFRTEAPVVEDPYALIEID
ncbi:MAG TPA: phospholipase D-like domain-containing protein [Nocardioidaceae bacterium]|nr:phospholipase D-like domain-containing protein [Nocardioidaceae bacterium]